MKTEKHRFCCLVIMHVRSYLIDNRDHYLGRHYQLNWPLKAMNSLVLRHLKWDWLIFGAKNCPSPPSKFFFFFSGIEDFAVLGTYIIDYIRVLVPNGVYLRYVFDLFWITINNAFLYRFTWIYESFHHQCDYVASQMIMLGMFSLQVFFNLL